MNRETEIVIALCRTPLTPAALSRGISLVMDDVDFDRLFLIAAAFEVEPVFFSNLRSLNSRIPGEVLERAATRGRNARAFALSRTLLLVDLYRKMENAGIPVIVLKGPALGAMAYDDASMRTYHDIDFLTSRESLPVARNLLLQLGYARDYKAESERSLIAGNHALEFSGSGTKVELHYALVERHLRFDLDMSAVWNDATAVSCAGAEIKVLDPARLLLFICAHGAKHEWVRVRWICDVAHLAERLDESQREQVVALANRAHARRILSMGLRLSHEVFGLDGPGYPAYPISRYDDESIITYVLQQHGIRDVCDTSATRLARMEPGARSLFFWAKSRERWMDRLASVAWVMFIPTDKDQGIGALGWLTRPLRLMLRFARRSVTGGGRRI